MSPEQLLAPAPLHNLRPVGGLPTINGEWVRDGVVWRSAAPLARRQSASETVASLGIRTIIDLRDARERASAPGAWQHEALTTCPLPVFEDRLHSIRFADLAELYEVMIDESGAALARAFAAVATSASISALASASASTGVLLHCTAGKDRTGVLSALLLDVLGVERSLVLADFAQSQQRLGSDYLADLFADIDADTLPGMAAHKATASPPELLEGAFARIENTWGSSHAYLLAHGLNEEHLTRLRSVMVTANGARP